MRQPLFIVLKSIAIGWASMLLIDYVFVQSLQRWIGTSLGIEWLATVRLALDCLTLTATGWIVGRLNRGGPILGVLSFAATLIFFDHSRWIPTDIPRFMHLGVEILHDTRFLDAFGTLAASQVLLFGCLVAGGLLSRARVKPISIA